MSEPNYTIFGVCNRIPTEDYYCFKEWEKSTEGMNKFVVAGIGSHYTGLCDKAKFLYRAIKFGHIKTKYLIICDTWDLVFCCPPEEIILKFLGMSCDIVFSAEKNCFPDDLKKEFDELNTYSTYKYLNSGMIVGRTDAILRMLEDMKVEEIPNDYWDGEKNIHFNDQFEYQKEYIRNKQLFEPPNTMRLDYDCILSIPLHQVTIEELDFSEPRIRVKETNSYPCTLHMNGSSKTDGLRNPILTHLNLL